MGLRRRHVRPVQRPPRLKGLSLNRLLPNVLTLLALCAGVTGIRFAVHGAFEAAVVAIMTAAVLDTLDGRIARLLNGQSKFGAELDSLSDVISFGVAPAMILYMWELSAAGTFGWISVLALCVCAALRLARFNTRLGESDLPPYAYNYFTGVPAPAGAGLALLPVVISFEAGEFLFGNPWFVVPWVLVVALMMVSELPTFSLKGVRVPQRWVIPVLAGIGLLAAALVSRPWLTLALIAAAYAASLPFSYRQYHRLREEAQRLHDELMANAEDLPEEDAGPRAPGI